MKLPDWLYERREGVRRWGSTKVGICLMYADHDPGYMPVCWMGCIWRFNFMFGPAGGVEAGIYDVGPAHIFYRRRPGRVFAVAWEESK